MNLYYVRMNHYLYDEPQVQEMFINAKSYDEAREIAENALGNHVDGSYFIYSFAVRVLFVEDYERILTECRKAFEELGTRVASKLGKNDI